MRALADYAYYIVADWPKYGRQIWREGFFDTEKAADEAWAKYKADNPEVTLVSLNRVDVFV